jgi:hypothetical protein
VAGAGSEEIRGGTERQSVTNSYKIECYSKPDFI